MALMCVWMMAGYSHAQDIHFSQYRAVPVYVNPAQAGFCFARARFSAVHRSQWRAVSVPFNTFSFSTDFKLFQDRQSRNIVGMGINTYYDQAGDSKFGTSSVGGAMSYLRAINEFSNHYLGLGMAYSYNDRSYDYSKLVFGTQFNGKNFDPDLYNGETFLNRGFKYHDVTAGVHWFYRPDMDQAFDAGFVVSHLNRPPQSMLNNDEIRLDPKFTFYLNAEIIQPNKQTLSPGIYVARQGTYTEVIAGTMVSLDRLSGGYNLQNIQAGLFLRPVDAAIMVFQFDYQHITFGISYDVNYSKLRNASTLRGGFELTAVYMVQKKKKKKIKNIPCPDPF
jgi:type IX secretion system PorP/SprF family membrane protein